MKRFFLSVTIFLLIQISKAQNVGIATSTPDSSAQLEVSSNTKGFLPPRMTFNQRNAIKKPAQGLIIYCNDCGTNGGVPQYYNGKAWLNMSADTLTSPIVIGANYGGGKIAYILQQGDSGYTANQLHGLIVAPVSVIVWSNDYAITGATGTALGTGDANTNKIVSSQGAGNYAAKLCADLVLNGYNDWYLPSKDELNKLYINKNEIGFSNSVYWSSSEYDNTNAWGQFFTNGNQAPANKFANAVVVATRAF